MRGPDVIVRPRWPKQTKVLARVGFDADFGL
jgi:hypothetical protein